MSEGSEPMQMFAPNSQSRFVESQAHDETLDRVHVNHNVENAGNESIGPASEHINSSRNDEVEAPRREGLVGSYHQT